MPLSSPKRRDLRVLGGVVQLLGQLRDGFVGNGPAVVLHHNVKAAALLPEGQADEAVLLHLADAVGKGVFQQRLQNEPGHLPGPPPVGQLPHLDAQLPGKAHLLDAGVALCVVELVLQGDLRRGVPGDVLHVGPQVGAELLGAVQVAVLDQPPQHVVGVEEKVGVDLGLELL